MESLNPRSPDEVREQIEEERFLSGAGQWKHRLIALIVAITAMVVPAALSAHEGHAHKVMGTVSSISGKHVTVKTAEGKSVMVMLDDKTKVTQGKDAVDASKLKVGDRVVAEGPEEKEMIMATTVKLGVAPATVAKK